MDPLERDRDAVRTLTSDWLAAERRRDIPALLAMVTDDAVFLMPNGQLLKGKPAIEQLYRTYFEQWSSDHRATFDEVQVAGDWAFAWGHETTTLQPMGGGDALQFRGFGMSILARGTDGQWRFARGINNMAPERPRPPAGAGARGRGGA
jgi:uncharacterized protein (TIGR02246 family)